MQPVPAIVSHFPSSQSLPVNFSYFQPVSVISRHIQKFQPLPAISSHFFFVILRNSSHFQPFLAFLAIVTYFQSSLAISIIFRHFSNFQLCPAISSKLAISSPIKPFSDIQASPSISIHSRHFQPCSAMYIHSIHKKPFLAVCSQFSHFQIFLAISRYFQPCQAMYSHSFHFQKKILKFPKKNTVMSSHSKQFQLIPAFPAIQGCSSHLKPCKAISIHCHCQQFHPFPDIFRHFQTSLSFPIISRNFHPFSAIS